MDLKNKLIKKARKEFPDLKFKKAELVTKGWDHDVLVLDNKYIVRFSKDKLYGRNFIKEIKFLKEFGKLSNLRVPHYTHISKDKRFGVYEIIEGEELTPAMYRRLSKKKKQKIAQDLGIFLTTLHRVPVKNAKKYGFRKFIPWEQKLKQKRKWFKEEFLPKVSPKLTKKQNDFINNFISSFYYSDYKIKPTLGHYDLSHDHIIMKKDGSISGIIDFGDLSVYDPAHEFNGFFEYDKSLLVGILKHYKGQKDKNFLKRSEQHFIDRWIYLLYDGLVRKERKSLYNEARKSINKIIKGNYKF